MPLKMAAIQCATGPEVLECVSIGVVLLTPNVHGKRGTMTKYGAQINLASFQPYFRTLKHQLESGFRTSRDDQLR